MLKKRIVDSITKSEIKDMERVSKLLKIENLLQGIGVKTIATKAKRPYSKYKNVTKIKTFKTVTDELLERGQPTTDVGAAMLMGGDYVAFDFDIPKFPNAISDEQKSLHGANLFEWFREKHKDIIDIDNYPAYGQVSKSGGIHLLFKAPDKIDIYIDYSVGSVSEIEKTRCYTQRDFRAAPDSKIGWQVDFKSRASIENELSMIKKLENGEVSQDEFREICLDATHSLLEIYPIINFSTGEIYELGSDDDLIARQKMISNAPSFHPFGELIHYLLRSTTPIDIELPDDEIEIMEREYVKYVGSENPDGVPVGERNHAIMRYIGVQKRVCRTKQRYLHNIRLFMEKRLQEPISELDFNKKLEWAEQRWDEEYGAESRSDYNEDFLKEDKFSTIHACHFLMTQPEYKIYRYIPDVHYYVRYNGKFFDLKNKTDVLPIYSRPFQEYKKYILGEFDVEISDVPDDEQGKKRLSYLYKKRAQLLESIDSIGWRADCLQKIQLLNEYRTPFEQFDANTRLLNLQNGKLVLHDSGAYTFVEGHHMDDMFTKIANVSYDKNAPRPQMYLDGLSNMMANRTKIESDAITEFLLYMQGSMLSGDVHNSQLICIVSEQSDTGKSEIMSVPLGVLGTYGAEFNIQLLQAYPNTIDSQMEAIKLKGARYIVSRDTSNESFNLSDQFMKFIAPDYGQRMSGRYMRQNAVEFVPQFKAFCGANTLPNIEGSDSYISKRLKIFEFDVKFVTNSDNWNVSHPDYDPNVAVVRERIPKWAKTVIEKEGSGLLNLYLQYYELWAKNNFMYPDTTKLAEANVNLDKLLFDKHICFDDFDALFEVSASVDNDMTFQQLRWYYSNYCIYNKFPLKRVLSEGQLNRKLPKWLFNRGVGKHTKSVRTSGYSYPVKTIVYTNVQVKERWEALLDDVGGNDEYAEEEHKFNNNKKIDLDDEE